MGPRGGEKRRRALLSCFICLNLGTVLYMNFSSSFDTSANQFLASVPGGSLLRLVGWADARYAHAAGLDNRWVMFGYQSRFNWRYLIKGQYRNRSSVVLPIEGQMPRTFWQRNLFDFKEAKFRLNIYPSKAARQAYGEYLCRQFPSSDGWPIESVLIELHTESIAAREVAESSGSHRSSEITSILMDRVPCPHS
jgi:hypothetical protein